MNVKTIVPITEARKNIFKINTLVKAGTPFTFTEKGYATSVLISAEEYESLLETIAVMQEMPNLRESIRKAEEDYHKGRTISLEDYLKKRTHRRMSKRTKSKKHVSRSPLARSRKGSR